MLDLNAFFDGMSKPLLRNAHAKAFGCKGLLNNALIQSETLSYYENKDRVTDLFSKMEPWQQRCLEYIYNSASRGLTLNEIRLTVPVGKAKDLQKFLLDMCREYVLWRTPSGNSTAYFGFSNFVGCIDFRVTTELSSSTKFVSAQNLIDWHICLVLSYAMRKGLKVNTNGSIHRRSYQECVDSFLIGKQVSDSVAENELALIFNFLTSNGWLEQEESFLVPSERALDFIRKNGFRLHQDLVSWWLKERFHGNREHCVRLLRNLLEVKPAADVSRLFWVLDPSSRLIDKNKDFAWEYLPRPLRELWMLGLAKFQMVDGKVAGVVLEQSGKDWIDSSIASVPEQSIACLPNFELIVSTGTSPRVLFTLACLSKVNNDETFLRFSLNKEVYIQGLKSGLPEAEIENFKNWIKPPENVASTLAEWNSSYYGAKVQTVRLLKIDDLAVLTELSHFPQFMDCVEELIPGYGFVLNPERERFAFEILETYGYCPFVERSGIERLPAAVDEWRKDFAVAWPEVKTPDYELKVDADDSSLQVALNSTKYGSNYQKLSTFDLVKVLRYAKTVGTLVGAKIKDPAKRNVKEEEKLFHVHALRLAKTPQVIEIQIQGKDFLENLDLSFIQEIKVFSGK